MLRNPGPVLQAYFDSVPLRDYLGTPTSLVILDAIQFDRAIELCEDEFGRYVPRSSVRPTLRYADRNMCFGISAGNFLIGAYLISHHSLRLRGPNLPSLERRPGIQGEALIVDPRSRGHGFGRILRDALPEVGRIIGVDYVWGGALDELKNLQQWLRRRVLVRSTGHTHITLEPIAADLKEAFLPFAGEHLRDRWMAELGIDLSSNDSFPQDWISP